MGKLTLDQWIAEALNDPEKDGRCTSIACVHRVGMSDEEVYAIKLNEGRSLDPKALAEIFLHKAKTQVQDIPGTQLFYLYAFYGDRAQPQAKLPFRINTDSELGLGTTEPPTEQGARQQGMRFSEVAFKNQQFVIEKLSGMVDTLMRHQMNAIQSVHDATELAQRVILEKASAAHDFRMKELEYQRSTEERKMLMKYAPIAVNALMPGTIPVESSDSALVEMVIEKLSNNPQAIQQLAGVLPPEIMGPLAQRANKYLQEKHEAEKAAAAALGNGKDPELLQ